MNIDEQTEERARQVARLMGEYSAAHNAIKELDSRRANGESDTWIMNDSGYWIVGRGEKPCRTKPSRKVKKI